MPPHATLPPPQPPLPRAVVVAFARDTQARWNEAAVGLPAGWLRRWWSAVTAGLGLSLAAVAGLVAVVRGLEDAGRLGWEADVVRRLGQAEVMSEHSASVLQTPGSGMVLGPLSLAGVVLAIRAKRPLDALSLLVGYYGAVALTMFGWSIWHRPRPNALYRSLVGFGDFFYAFPSGHSGHSVTVYGLLAALWLRGSASRIERALVVLGTATLVGVTCIARVRQGAHWPTDVLAGWLLGLVWLAVILVARRWASRPGGQAGT